jgi:hypothetical protein
MSKLVDDPRDPDQIDKLLQQLRSEGRITPEEHRVLSNALHRKIRQTNNAAIEAIAELSERLQLQ